MNIRSKSMTEIDQLEDLGLDGRILFKCTLTKEDVN
jgi:hypothetical protein